MHTSLLPQRTRARTPNNRTTTGCRLSDVLWAGLAPLLPVRVPTHRVGGGRPRVPDRRCAEAIVYVLRTGCPWDALHQTALWATSTASDRFPAWVDAGVFWQRWQVGVAPFDEWQGMDGTWLSLDGALTKAPLEEKNRSASNRPRYRRGQVSPVDRGPRRAAWVGSKWGQSA
jgi:transposase